MFITYYIYYVLQLFRPISGHPQFHDSSSKYVEEEVYILSIHKNSVKFIRNN